MRVLLISANTEQINMPVLPLGMAHVAAAAEEAGHTVSTLTLMKPEHAKELLAPTIEDFAPDLIGISVRNIDDQSMMHTRFLLPPVKQLIADCRNLIDVPIVLGGPGYSIFPASALSYLEADMGIQGEGELAFVMLLERLETNAPLDDIGGLYLRNGNSVRPTQRIMRLDDFPMPEPGIHMNIPSDVEDANLWIPFQTRRGCPMNCIYCSTPAIEGRLMRHIAPKTAVDALRQYVSAGYRRFFLVDNIFNLPQSFSENLCDAIVDAGLQIEWNCILYPANVEETLVEKMARAGCKGVSLGFETGSAKMLASLNKKFSIEEVRRVCALLGRYGIERMGFLLLGAPGETKETVFESLAFAKSLGLESMKISAGIRIYPDTPLAETARSQGVFQTDADLLFPTFYVEPALDGWLQDTVLKWVEQHPGWHM